MTAQNYCSMAQMNFGGVVETVVTSKEFSLEKAREVLKNETIAILGYGIQGPGQAGNLRDNGFNVIVGQRPGKTYDKAVADGWVPGKTLFSVEEAAQKGTIICMLLSDAGQIAVWPKIKQYLTPGKTLYYSHGFAINWNDRTGVVPPADVDVIMVAPKGSGTSLRTMFLEGRGLNCSYAVYQDHSGKAEEKTIAFGIGIGAGYLFKTTFQREATSDLTGERGSLMGAIEGLLEAQYEVLREHGHSPSEAFNETVEELTQSLMPLFAEKGMDGCMPTALQQLSVAPWIGLLVSARLSSLLWSGSTSQSRLATRLRSQSILTLSQTIVRNSTPNLRLCTTWRCGALPRQFASFVLRTRLSKV